MSNPVLGAAKVDKILSQFSQKLTNVDYISELILPVLKVKEKTGKFAKYGKENFRIYADGLFRNPGTRANNFDYSVSQGNYICQERALEKRVPDEFMNNTDDPYDARRDAVAYAMDGIWANKERALATVMENTAVITQNVTLAGTDQWSDQTNSDPIGDINTGIDVIRAATAKTPNTIVMSHKVMRQLLVHPDIREQLKYTNGGQLSQNDFLNGLKQFFNVKNIYIGSAVYDTADEGQTPSLGDVWGDHFWLLYQTDRPTLMQSTFGFTFSDVPRLVDTYREETHLSDVMRVRDSYDQNIMDASLAYLIKDAVA